MTQPLPDRVTTTVGLAVLHLFCKPTPLLDPDAVVTAVTRAEASGCQVVTVELLGHKSDAAFMALHADLRELRVLQTGLQHAGLAVVDSYVSLTEVSEYAKGMPKEMLRSRLFPTLPPEGKPIWCFYPMSKRRGADANWFTLPYGERETLMHEHGTSGRKFAGRVVQLITGSTGVDDYEWGVTLFGSRPDDLKDVVYTLRFDRASAIYAEFGAFYFGVVTAVTDLVHRL